MSSNHDHQHANPADYGWRQRAAPNAESRVEYYERGGVKMDYYPTTGTGKTQMFRRHLSGQDFSRVLDNPRAHTG
ncbi:hypothetical protein DFJ73DRAFT_777301 [Zopfochytrium polystomum]|nr:hypothetical protein DFJ73DRAFT_777301 [Zopfochytrium polystomum]